MLREDDEEYKKRLERARMLRNSIGMATESDLSSNATLYDNDFQERLNRARQLRNSVGMITENDFEPEKEYNSQLAQTINNDINYVNKNIDLEKGKTLIDATMNLMKNPFSQMKSIVEYNEQRKEEKEKAYENLTEKEKNEIAETKQQFQNITQNVSNNPETKSKVIDTKLSLAKPEETKKLQKVSDVQINALQEAEKKNKNIEKGGVDAFNEYIDTIMDNFYAGFGKKPIAGLANVVTTLAGLGIKSFENVANFFGIKDVASGLNTMYNNVVDLGSNINEIANYESTVTSQINDDFTRGSGQVTDVISNMLGNYAIGYAVGIPSTVIQGTSVGGSSAQEVLDENKDNIGQATVTGIAKGYVSYLTEKMFDANLLTRGQSSSISRLVDNAISNKLKSDFGKEFANRTVGIIGENLEELVEDNVDNLIDKLVNNKQTPDFLSKEWWDNTGETAKVTTLSTIIMSLLGIGGDSFKNKESDIQAERWINEAQDIINQENMAIHYDPRQVKSKNSMEQFYITQFNPEGQIESVTPTYGKEIENIQPKLMITPVVVKDINTNMYEVIDGMTGVVLDNSYYDSINEAETSYNKKVENLSENRISDINNTINEATYVIKNNLMEVVSQLENNLPEIATTFINNNTNTTDLSENENIDNLNNQGTNYTPKIEKSESDQVNIQNEYSQKDVKEITDQFKTQTEYTKNEMANIWNNEIDKNNLNVKYDDNGKIKSYIAIEEDGDNLKISQYDNNDNIVQSETIVPQNGKFTSDSINNTIEKVTGVYEQNNANKTPEQSKFYNDKPNYAVSNINEIETELNKKKSYTIDEIGEKWSDIQENTYDLTLDDDMYVELEEDNGKLEAILYDGSTEESPEINRVAIEKTKNGRYTAEAINNAIKEVAALQDENRPIKGQVDIEGNEVRNMKKVVNKKTSETKQVNAIKNLIKADDSFKRSDLKTIIDNFEIPLKEGVSLIQDKKMEQKAGHNQNPKITIINNIYEKIPRKRINEYADKSIDLAVNKFDKKAIEIKDTNQKAEFSKKGIDEIYSKNIDKTKINYADKLDKIVKESIYGYTTIKNGESQAIKRHNYFGVVKFNGENKLVRTVINEYTKNNVPNKIYFQKVENLKNKNEDLVPPYATKNSEHKVFEPKSSSTSIPQKNNSVKNNEKNATKNMKKNSGLTKTQYDSKGNEITYKQAQYFKNSKVRDNNGNLKVVYHGTNNAGFTEFKRNINYYTDNIDIAKTYTGNNGIYKGYINIENPIVVDANKELWSKIDVGNIKIDGVENIKEFLDSYGASTWKENGKIRTSTADIVSAISDAIEDGKFEADGIIINNVYDEGAYSDSTGKYLGNDYITFKSSQFKNTSNEAPTSNSDIRYMKKNNNTSYNNYSQKELENFKNSKTIRIANNENDVKNFVSNAKKMKSNLKLYFGKVKNNISDNIRNILNVDVSNYNISLKNDDIRKIFKDHGTEETELPRGQVPITENDFLKIPYIINNPDIIESAGVTDKGKPVIRFEKNINGNNVVITYVSDKHHNLEMQTMYKFKNNKKRDTSTGIYENNSPSLNTSETSSGTLSLTNSISQNNKSVKINEKNTTNDSPTSNNDIRFAKRSAKETNNIRNAERGESYIEQEIQKIEKTGNWDNSIPVTKLTDIRKTIEDYLGLGIKKGHFRQDAYAIYKGNNDVIRTKEYKDMDSILHETGHAIDLGKRLDVDKEAIANELLTAIDKLGGYEQESRTIRLEEGFAEVIREYSIVPEQAKQDYPQTVAVLEGLQKKDSKFNNFITKVQQQAYNYIHQNPRNRTLSNISIGEQTDKSKITKNYIKQEIMRNIYDKDWAVKSAVNELAKANGKTANQIKASENAYYLTRLATGTTDKVISMLSDGYIDENGNKLFPGLSQIGEILGNNPERYNDHRASLVANRDLEYKAKTLKTGLRDMDTKAVREQFKNDKQIQQANKLVYDTLNGVMQYAVNNGLISQDTADKLKQSNTFYVPMQRVLENRGNQVGRKGAVADIIKQRTGSELDVKDVYENIVANTSNIIRQVENNNVLKALYKEGKAAGLTGTVFDVIDAPMTKIGTQTLEIWKNELEKQGVNTNNLDLEKTIDLFAPNNKVDSQNLITSFIDDNGKRVYLQFNDEVLFNSLMNMDKKFMSKWLKLNSKANMPLRYGATMANLGFAIPNMISDTAQAAVYSTAGFIPVVDNALGVLDILASTNKTVRNFVNSVAPEYANRINNLYSLYEQSGATNSTRLSQYRESTQNLMSDVYGTSNKNLSIKEKYKPLKRLLDVLTYIPEISEQSTRFRVFEKNYEYYKHKGTAEMDARILAALESRDATQDFGRTGNLTREINQLIPFSAARVGSAYTFTEKIKANPKQVTARIALLTAIAMAIKAMGYDDKEIEELNQRKKDDNFVIRIGDQIVTIKKPQGILRSILNLTEYIQDLATDHIEEGKEGEKLANWLYNALADNLPADNPGGYIPNLAKPIAEYWANKNFYYNTDIVKSYDLDLPDSEQYYDYNSQLAILLGKVFNQSPAKIDNLISGYFGGLGTTVTSAMDYALGKAGVIPEKPEMGAEQDAVGKRFIVNVNTNSSSIDEIYNRKTELTKKQNGGTITSEEEEELSTIKSAISNMADLNKQIKEIKKDLTMSGTEKAEKIRVLQQEKTDTARQALGKELIHSENENKIESTQFYPNDTIKKNGYSLTLNSEQKKEYEQYAYEFYIKYEKQGLYNDEKLDEIKTKAKDYAKNQMFKKYRTSLVKTKK